MVEEHMHTVGSMMQLISLLLHELQTEYAEVLYTLNALPIPSFIHARDKRFWPHRGASVAKTRFQSCCGCSFNHMTFVGH